MVWCSNYLGILPVCHGDKEAEPESNPLTLTYVQNLWSVAKRMRLEKQSAEMSFLHRGFGLTLTERMRSSDTQNGESLLHCL